MALRHCRRAPLALGLAAALPLVLCLAGPARASAQLRLLRTDRTLPASGDPVWSLQLEVPGQPPQAFAALSGRADRQAGDRNRLGSGAPLPAGSYRLSEVVSLEEATDLPSELGRLVWIGLEPTFPTERRALGIHHDPSAGMGPESGTEGCIGVIKAQDLLALAELVQRHGITELEVMP
ncbi:MAG: L,D-transpeptidase [Synechococcus sp.]|nr:L,D-transpeptidase [Synechococcus sp.]